MSVNVHCNIERSFGSPLATFRDVASLNFGGRQGSPGGHFLSVNFFFTLIAMVLYNQLRHYVIP